MSRIREALLVLADGTVFEGEAIGADPPGGVATGEVVFNTVLSGYQEVITDPSYAGQIITFTYPHIGNYGVTPADDESRRPFCRGVIVRDLARRRSNWRSSDDLQSFLRRFGVPGIAGIDTRRLTRHIREAGSMPGAFGTADEATLKAAAAAEPGTDGIDLVAEVTIDEPYRLADGSRPLVVAYDFGIKRTILRHLASWFDVEVVPASTSAADVPIFGICLGHQILALALGAKTFKLPFGHHGGNHPVRNLATGAVEITSQNHNFAVDADSIGDRAVMSHVNLNDGVCEGLKVLDAPAYSVQHHPEAGPGPHDSAYLFEEFATMLG
ncbi:MAG TPA: carbamoyl-phosphate synthase small subunit, partial [Acidimicrobiales bacterium]